MTDDARRTPDARYAREEAERIPARNQCKMGHIFDVRLSDGGVPVLLRCRRCGKSFDVVVQERKDAP